MAKKPKRQIEKDYHAAIAQLPCLVPDCQAPSNVHHIRTQQIKNHFLVLPLCREHHQGCFSIHACPLKFTNIFGSELHLLARVNEMMFKISKEAK